MEENKEKQCKTSGNDKDISGGKEEKIIHQVPGGKIDITCRKREGKNENISGAKEMEQIKIHLTEK